MAEWIGRTVSKVEIQKLLSRGGMAEVYLGRHTTLNRPVAVKVLQAHLSEDFTLLNRFESEAQSVASMRHPNIVQVFDFDIAEDQPYMVMEMLEGPSLKDYLAAQEKNNLKLPPRTIARLVAALASALDYAHARGIVHRDIKPANIMLRRASGPVDPLKALPSDAEPVLTDFGVARIANATAHTASGTIIGTPAYMSPEQVRGAVIDSRSDIYSLGIVLYEMLVGKVPFSAETQASVLLQQINDPPPPLPAPYEHLQPVLDRALAKDPNHRFQKATDLAAVLEASLGLPDDTGATEPRIAREAILAQDESSTVKLSPPTRSDVTSPASLTSIQPPGGVNPLWVAAGIGGLALVVGLVALGIVLSGGRGGAAGSLPGETPAQAASGTQAGTQAAGAALLPPVGEVLFRDATLGGSLSGLQTPPAGSVYVGWLSGDGEQPLNLGKLEVFDGRASVDFKAPDGKNLLPRYTTFSISLEPDSAQPALKPSRIVYSGQMAAETLKQLEALNKVWPDTSLTTALSKGIILQATVYDGHLKYTLDAIDGKDLAHSKQHAEHVVNITVGENDPDYGDLDHNGRAENPGDGVGLRVYLKLLAQAVKDTAAAPDASAEVRAAANEITQTVTQSLTTLGQAVQIEKGITAADTMDEVTGTADQLKTLFLKDILTQLAQKTDSLNLGLSVEVRPVAP